MGTMTTISFLALGIWLGAPTSAYATTTMQVVETDPPGDVVTLSRNQSFYLHLRYQTDQPVHIWALMAFVVLRLFVGVSVDPTSRYPWSFEILPAGALSAVIMIGLVVARKVAGVRNAL